MALALVPMPARAQVDEATAPALTTITGAQRRLDATTSSRELARGVGAHVEMANRLYLRARDSALRAPLAAAVSEAAGFAAWLHADMHDAGTTRIYYRLAIERARRAGQGLLAGYMLGSLAAFETEGTDPALALPLIKQARQQVGKAPYPTPRAWLDAIEALALAAWAKDRRAADASLQRAEAVITKGHPSAPPPWPWVFPFDHAKLAGYRALVAVRLGRAADALAAFAESLPATHPAPKQRAILMLEVATAARQDGEHGKDTHRVDQAFQLAREGLATGVAYSSERVIERARRFRREYSGPATPKVREFDDELRSAVS